MDTLLITGGAGFIGSNFVHFYLKQNTDVQIVNLDSLTYAGDMTNLEGLCDPQRHHFVEGDICDAQLVENLFQQFDIKGVIHFAAESHVDNSIEGPGVFVQTNMVGTYTLLEAARNHWFEGPFAARSGYQDCRFLHISTDEVYGSLGAEGYFLETTPYAPNSPYSASKAGSDMLVRSYNKTFGMHTIITNCSNNYGPRQNDEKLIPVVIRSALAGNAIPIYGDGSNIRDWLFVEDHCSGIARAYDKAASGNTYNIGTNCEKTNLDLAHEICAILDRLAPLGGNKSYSEQITFVNDRPGHDRRYAIDSSKIKQALGWSPAYAYNDALALTVDWYLKRYAGENAGKPAA